MGNWRREIKKLKIRHVKMEKGILCREKGFWRGVEHKRMKETNRFK